MDGDLMSSSDVSFDNAVAIVTALITTSSSLAAAAAATASNATDAMYEPKRTKCIYVSILYDISEKFSQFFLLIVLFSLFSK